MGLIKAAFGAAGGVLADQWKEYFYCDSIPDNVLMVKGEKRTSKRSSNTKGSDNVISNGSVIAVADGQAMIIVDQGRIAEFCAERSFDKTHNSFLLFSNCYFQDIRYYGCSGLFQIGCTLPAHIQIFTDQEAPVADQSLADGAIVQML